MGGRVARRVVVGCVASLTQVCVRGAGVRSQGVRWVPQSRQVEGLGDVWNRCSMGVAMKDRRQRAGLGVMSGQARRVVDEDGFFCRIIEIRC